MSIMVAKSVKKPHRSMKGTIATLRIFKILNPTNNNRKLLQQPWMDIDAENFPSVDDVGASSRACRDPGLTTATCGVAADLRDLGHLSDG